MNKIIFKTRTINKIKILFLNKKIKVSGCCCPLCGEEFLKGNFRNSGEKKDYFDCRKCENHQVDEYYFKCGNCGSKFCTDCPKRNSYIPNYSCPLCGEQFSRGLGLLKNSGENKDYFDCRKCGNHQSNKYYFKCGNCGSKFCTRCPENNNYVPNYSCPLCGEQFLRGRGNFVNSGENKDYFDCRKCGRHESNKFYFKCNKCRGKFCTSCPQNKNYVKNYSCPLCGEQFLGGGFINSGENKDYFNCRKCGRLQSNKHYFKCNTCGSKFCTSCPEQ